MTEPQDRFNVELKARVESIEQLRPLAERMATEYLGVMEQRDTYFAGARGRLKLREIDGRTAQLIWYERPDRADAKTSRYQLVAVEDAPGLKAALAEAYGVWQVVDKRREVFLYENVRIHLDRVQGLGDFLEFEAVLESEREQARGHEQLAHLCQAFSLDAARLLSGSYSDLLGS